MKSKLKEGLTERGTGDLKLFFIIDYIPIFTDKPFEDRLIKDQCFIGSSRPTQAVRAASLYFTGLNRIICKKC